MQSEPSAIPSIMLWAGVLLGAIVLMFFVATYVRGWIKNEKIDDSAGGFGLGDLRRLHEQGQLSDEEFERARAAMTLKVKAALERHEEERRQRETGQPQLSSSLRDELVAYELEKKRREAAESFSAQGSGTGGRSPPPLPADPVTAPAAGGSLPETAGACALCKGVNPPPAELADYRFCPRCGRALDSGRLGI